MRRRNPDNEKRIAAFFADFSAATRRCPFEKHGVERMFPDVPVSILFLRDEDEDYITLGELKAHPGIRATGAGTEAMRRILDLADKHDLTVLLYPSPLDAGWSRARLMRWYASFGFTFLVEDADERQDSGDYTMMRVPHSKGARRPNPRTRARRRADFAFDSFRAKKGDVIKKAKKSPVRTMPLMRNGREDDLPWYNEPIEERPRRDAPIPGNKVFPLSDRIWIEEEVIEVFVYGLPRGTPYDELFRKVRVLMLHDPDRQITEKHRYYSSQRESDRPIHFARSIDVGLPEEAMERFRFVAAPPKLYHAAHKDSAEHISRHGITPGDYGKGRYVWASLTPNRAVRAFMDGGYNGSAHDVEVYEIDMTDIPTVLREHGYAVVALLEAVADFFDAPHIRAMATKAVAAACGGAFYEDSRIIEGSVPPSRIKKLPQAKKNPEDLAERPPPLGFNEGRTPFARAKGTRRPNPRTRTRRPNPGFPKAYYDLVALAPVLQDRIYDYFKPLRHLDGANEMLARMLRDAGYRVIGVGGVRVVVDVGEGFAAKVACDAYGDQQNRAEAAFWKAHPLPDLMPVHAFSQDGSISQDGTVLLTERAETPVSEAEARAGWERLAKHPQGRLIGETDFPFQWGRHGGKVKLLDYGDNPLRPNPRRRNPDQRGQGIDPRILAADGARYFSDAALAEADREAAPSKSRTALVLMHPRDFLKMAEPGKREEAQAALERVLDAGTRLSDVPRLFIDVSRGDATVAVVTGHEGRHRSRALLARGVTQMPVRIHSHNIRWGEQTDPESWDYEPVLPSVLFGEGANRQNILPMPVPLHYPELAPRLHRSLVNPRRNPDTSRALSDAQIRNKKALADKSALDWGIPAGWQNGAEDIRDAEAFLAWVHTAPTTFRVYRALRLRDPSYLHTEGIGTYWAWKRSGANVYQDDTSSMREALRAGEGNVYLVVGEVDTQHVDWGRTFFKNLYDAPWEHEIEIVEGSPIRLVGMFRTDELGYPSTERWRDSTVNHLHTPVMARANPSKRSRR